MSFLQELYVGLMLLVSPINTAEGKATVYWPGDKFSGRVRADGQPFTSKDEHIAHRRIPLQTKGVLCNFRTAQCTPTFVGDRGPFGAIRPCKEECSEGIRHVQLGNRRIEWQAQIKLEEGWVYPIAFDLTRAVAERIGYRSGDRVVFFHPEPRQEHWLSRLILDLLEAPLADARLANRCPSCG